MHDVVPILCSFEKSQPFSVFLSFKQAPHPNFCFVFKSSQNQEYSTKWSKILEKASVLIHKPVGKYFTGA